MLGALMFASKKLMEAIPNVHLLGVFIIAMTVVYRFKALYPIYIYVLLDGIFLGFSPWWTPYLYIWTLLWGAAMLLPRNMPKELAVPVYMTLNGLHGLLFGTLYAPAHALFFHLSLKATVAWIIQGLPYDAIHGASNLICGLLIVPMIGIMKKYGT